MAFDNRILFKIEQLWTICKVKSNDQSSTIYLRTPSENGQRLFIYEKIDNSNHSDGLILGIEVF